ncbi:tetratricopeptide repeat protein [Saccharopolyspora sp. NPDC002376]
MDQQPTNVRNVLGDRIGQAVQAGQIHGGVNFYMTPGAGPGLGSVTPPTASHDVRGRDDLVESVVEALSGQGCVVLHGAGGYGKTTVAQRMVADLDVETWWVDASSDASLHEGLREVALRAGADPEEVHRAWEGLGLAPDLLWRQLSLRETRWLLVLDNADDASVLGAGRPVAEGTGWLRTSKSGAVLITSRDGNPQVWGDLAQLQAVGPLASGAGAQVLLDRAPTAGTFEQAGELAERLGGLPLALHSAGQYLSVAATMPRVPGLELPVDFNSYRIALDERWPEVTELPGAPHSQREVLDRTWELSLDLLTERGHPMARPLLRALSQFAAAPIPLELLIAEVLARAPEFDGLTALELAAVLGALSGVGLVETTTHGEEAIPVLRLHPVIRETNRHQGDEFEQASYVGRFIVMLASAVLTVDPEDHANWPCWRLLLPHCARLAVLADQDGELREALPEEIGDMCIKAAKFCNETAQFAQARDLLELALVCYREELGDEHRRTLTARNNLAGVLQEQGEHEQAEAEFREVLELSVQVHGEAHPGSLAARSNLAGMLWDRGEAQAAEAEFRTALELSSQAVGEEHPQTLAFRGNLAVMLRDCGELAQAEAELREVLRLQLRARGESDVVVWMIRNSLALVLCDRGDFEQAEAEYRALLAPATRLLGEENPNTLILRHNLAQVLMERGERAEAEVEYRRVWELRCQVFGERHPDTRLAKKRLDALS